jgi:branched-chain amino acid transport system permease protein
MQVIVNGLVSGAAIALLATAFQAVYLPTRVFFIGLAGVYSISPYIAYSAIERGWGWPPAVALALSFAVVASVMCEWLNHARLSRRGASSGAHMISSLGIYIAMVQLIGIGWGNESKALREGAATAWHFGGIVVTQPQTLVIGVAVIAIISFSIILTRSRLGLQLRAMADNELEFALRGYNVNKHRVASFAIAGLLAAASGLVLSYDVGFDPHVGLDALLLAIAAVIIGGRGSFVGPGVAGVILGILRSEVVWQFGSRWQDVAAFALLLMFLLLRPQGLMGQSRRIEAKE